MEKQEIEKGKKAEERNEQEDEEDFFSKEEQEKVKARLRAQGYID